MPCRIFSWHVEILMLRLPIFAGGFKKVSLFSFARHSINQKPWPQLFSPGWDAQLKLFPFRAAIFSAQKKQSSRKFCPNRQREFSWVERGRDKAMCVSERNVFIVVSTQKLLGGEILGVGCVEVTFPIFLVSTSSLAIKATHKPDLSV